MTGLLWAALGILGGLGMTAIGDMVSEEVRDRLDHLPNAILRLAARRLDPAQRATIYEEVWLPDLAYYLKGEEARPVTRLVTGTGFAIGILAKARRIERNLSPAAQYQPMAEGTNDRIARIAVSKPDLLVFAHNRMLMSELKVQLYVDACTGPSEIHSWLDRCVLDDPDRER